MTTPTPADAVRAAIDALRNATNAEIAAAAIRAAADALLPRPAIGDQSKGAVQARLLRLQFLGLANEVKGTPLPAASREALAEAREESQSAAWGDIEPDQVLPAVEALARSVALTSEDILPGPYSENDLRKLWNSQADVDHPWDDLESYEQLAWAQTQAIAADRAALAEPAGEGEERWYPNFADWLEREMPEGTVIGDPLWWASKIATYLAKWGRPAALADKPEVEEEQREAVRAAVTEALGDVYDWMGEHDFTLVAGDPGRVAEIADAAIEAMRPAAVEPTPSAPAKPQPHGGRQIPSWP